MTGTVVQPCSTYLPKYFVGGRMRQPRRWTSRVRCDGELRSLAQGQWVVRCVISAGLHVFSTGHFLEVEPEFSFGFLTRDFGQGSILSLQRKYLWSWLPHRAARRSTNSALTSVWCFSLFLILEIPCLSRLIQVRTEGNHRFG